MDSWKNIAVVVDDQSVFQKLQTTDDVIRSIVAAAQNQKMQVQTILSLIVGFFGAEEYSKSVTILDCRIAPGKRTASILLSFNDVAIYFFPRRWIVCLERSVHVGISNPFHSNVEQRESKRSYEIGHFWKRSWPIEELHSELWLQRSERDDWHSKFRRSIHSVFVWFEINRSVYPSVSATDQLLYGKLQVVDIRKK